MSFICARGFLPTNGVSAKIKTELNLIFKRAIIWLFNLGEVMGVLRKPFKEEMRLGLFFFGSMRKEESKELKMLGLGGLKLSTLGI